MRVRSTIIALLLAMLSVGAAIYTGDGWSEPRLPTAQQRKLISPEQLPVDELIRITLKRAGKPTLVFSRTGAQWRQIQPFEYPMDPYSIRQFAILAREMDAVDRLEPDDLKLNSDRAQSLAAMQLDPPAAEIMYDWPNGSLTLQLGRRSVAGRAYIRIAGEDPIFVSGYKLHERALETDPKEWRDRTVFHDAGVESARVECEQGGAAKMVLARDRKQWKMLEPVQTRIDSMARDAYFQALGVAKASGFILDQPTSSDLGRFGLAPAVAAVTVTSAGGSPVAPEDGVAATTQKLLVGARVSANSQDRFGLIEGRPVVVRLSGAVLGAIFRQPENLIEPTGSGVQPADVKVVVIRAAGTELKLERALERWRAPELGGAEVNPAHVQEMLEQLTQLRAPAVQISPYPADMEVATVTFHGYDGKAIDTVRIAQDKQTDRWMLENGDHVLRLFPAGLKIRMTAADYGL
jgi:hypothetical protein